MTISQVLIVGAGLGGPTLALSLARHNIRSTIFEIRGTRSDKGGSLSLTPPGLRVLDHYAGVYDKIAQTGFNYYRMGMYDDGGRKMGDFVGGQEGVKGGYPSVRIMRPDLHSILMDACAEKADLIKVVYGAKLEKIEEEEKGVTAFFEDGSKATADVLVGADGIHSKVRQHILGADSPTPRYIGVCHISGYLPTSKVILPDNFSLPFNIFSPNGFIMVMPRDPDAKIVGWGVSNTLPEPAGGRDAWNEYVESGEAARLAKAQYSSYTSEPFRSLLDNVDEVKDIKIWAHHSTEPLRTWHTTKVCLIGDAAHALPPNGQGSALAFEDAAFLARLLATQSDKGTERVFAHFERVRRERVNLIAKLSKGAGTAKFASSPLVYWLKKTAFSWFFWFKNYEFKSEEMLAYDVDQLDGEVV
ncbi:FAD/NAD(P)-binding domain-containing protein [Meredithblackwellia eburnea MCA 4105]